MITELSYLVKCKTYPPLELSGVGIESDSSAARKRQKKKKEKKIPWLKKMEVEIYHYSNIDVIRDSPMLLCRNVFMAFVSLIVQQYRIYGVFHLPLLSTSIDFLCIRLLLVREFVF